MKKPTSLLPAVGASTVLILLAAVPTPAAIDGPTDEPDPRDAFFASVSAQCGSTFEGYSSFPVEGPFAGKLLVATVASCSETEIRIPFAVGDDHSRTWILTRADRGLRLQHDHRHEDGTPDEITMYGGWATADGGARSQSFAADEHTRGLIPEAATNVWQLRLSVDGDLTYYLERHSEPRFEATLRLRPRDP